MLKKIRENTVTRCCLIAAVIAVVISAMLISAPVFASDGDVSSFDFHSAPGGTVKSNEELILALGGEECCNIDAAGNVLLKWDIELLAPIIFSEGSYTLCGAGNIIKISFSDAPAFKLVNSSSLTVGKGGGSANDIALDLIASGEKTDHSVFECYGDSVLTINSDVKITGNDKNGDGGAVYASGKEVVINGGIFSDNKAVKGGAIAVKSGKLSLKGGTVLRNSAQCGGGVYVSSGAVFTVTDGKIGGEYDAEVIEADYSKVTDGNKANIGGGVYCEKGSSFSSAGGTICSNVAEEDGGGIYCESETDINLYSISILFNTAQNGGAVYSLSDIDMSETMVCYNRAYGSGGGIWNGADLHLISGSISVNSAAQNGGGVFNRGYVELISAGIYDNVTGEFGGGVFNEGKMDFGGGYVSRNECQKRTFSCGIFNLGELNMAGIAYAGTENPITLVKRDDGYTYINVIGEFDGGITMAAIETVEETQNSDGSLVYTETGDHDFVAIKGDGEMIKTAVTHLVIEKYKNVERTLNELGEIVAVPQTQLYLLIAAGAAVAVVAAAVIVILVKSKKKASNNARSDETAS